MDHRYELLKINFEYSRALTILAFGMTLTLLIASFSVLEKSLGFGLFLWVISCILMIVVISMVVSTNFFFNRMGKHLRNEIRKS